MTTNLWVNEKGRILGPYTIDKLKELVDENWLSKMHLISEDRKRWISADEYQNGLLWSRTVARVNENSDIDQPSEYFSGKTTSPTNDESMWWYAKNGTREGPIPLSQLKDLFERGDLKPDDQVWTESMKDWRPAFVITDIEHYLNLN